MIRNSFCWLTKIPPDFPPMLTADIQERVYHTQNAMFNRKQDSHIDINCSTLGKKIDPFPNYEIIGTSRRSLPEIRLKTSSRLGPVIVRP